MCTNVAHMVTVISASVPPIGNRMYVGGVSAILLRPISRFRKNRYSTGVPSLKELRSTERSLNGWIGRLLLGLGYSALNADHCALLIVIVFSKTNHFTASVHGGVVRL